MIFVPQLFYHFIVVEKIEGGKQQDCKLFLRTYYYIVYNTES